MCSDYQIDHTGPVFCPCGIDQEDDQDLDRPAPALVPTTPEPTPRQELLECAEATDRHAADSSQLYVAPAHQFALVDSRGAARRANGSIKARQVEKKIENTASKQSANTTK